MHNKNPWPEPIQARLADLVAKGLSAGLIADSLAKEFPDYPFTRNSIVGRLQRTNLRLRGQPSQPSRPKPPPKTKPPASPTATPTPSPTPAPELSGYTLNDLPPNGCRWIEGDPHEERPFTCRNQSRPGVAYCQVHHRRAFATRTGAR